MPRVANISNAIARVYYLY